MFGLLDSVKQALGQRRSLNEVNKIHDGEKVAAGNTHCKQYYHIELY